MRRKLFIIAVFCLVFVLGTATVFASLKAGKSEAEKSNAEKNVPFTTSSIATDYVPYTGAISDVDLGAHTLTTTGYIASGPLYVSNSDSEMQAKGDPAGSPILTLKRHVAQTGKVYALRIEGEIADFEAGIDTYGNAEFKNVVVSNGLRLNAGADFSTQPACNASLRGTFWAQQGGAGVKDSVEVCAKDALDAYAWRTLY